jgi:hypothetical protein
MRYRSRLMGLGVAGLLALSAAETARGQVVAQPVFSNNALFQPEIDVVNSGVVTDIQATVSADRKYVTLNMRAQNAQLVNLFVFNFQSAGTGGGGTTVQLPSGFVGGVNPVVSGVAGGLVPNRPNAPMRVAPGNGGVILLKRGITPLVVP